MAGGSTTARRTNPLASGTTTEGGGRGEDKKAEKEACCPMLDKETLLLYLPTFAMAALLGITAINVLSSNQSMSGDASKNTKNKGLRQFLLGMPYTCFLFAFMGLAAAVAVRRKPRFLGCATGYLLGQLVCLVVIGGVVTQVRGEVKTEIVWPVTGAIVVILLVVWGVMFAYPKWLRYLLFSSCCRPKEEGKEKDDSDICKDCGGDVVDGRSSKPAADGVEPCEKCGGARAQFPGIVIQ